MENASYPRQPGPLVAGSPPPYNNKEYKQLGEELVEFPSQPVQHVQSTVVTLSDEPPVRDYVVWSIVNLLYLNFCCLGLLALVFSVKARDRKMVNDKLGARSYSSTSLSLNIAATVLSILCVIFFVILMIAGIIAIPSLIENNQNSYNFNSGNFGK